MSLPTNKGMSAPMGSQPCLKKAMQMMTMIHNKDDSPVQCHVCVHHPMCCTVLKNVTACPPHPPTHTFLKWLFLKDFKGLLGGFLAVQSVPVPICRGLFGSAKCPSAHM